MGIQITQTFPHCARCGRMMHTSQQRIVAHAEDGSVVQFCSELCRDEYRDLNGLGDNGAWKTPAAETRR